MGCQSKQKWTCNSGEREYYKSWSKGVNNCTNGKMKEIIKQE